MLAIESGTAYQSALPLRQRIVILSLVVAAHAAVLSQNWLAAPARFDPVAHELTVSIVPSAARRSVVTPPVAASVAVPRTVTEKIIAEPQSVTQPAETAPAETPYTPTVTDVPAQAAVPVLPDREPDHRAAYLDNPQPDYPLIARRMGWQGKVVLEVEVLPDGTAGEVGVQESSGRTALDEAALRAVRGWRFVPARQGGVLVAKRFLVPIQFSLK